MKKTIFSSVYFFVFLTGMVHSSPLNEKDVRKWRVYRTNFYRQALSTKSIKEDGKKKVTLASLKGVLSSLLVEKVGLRSERHFVLSTPSGRVIDLASSGVAEDELKNFSRRHPVNILFQASRKRRDSSNKGSMGVSLETGKVFEVRQEKNFSGNDKGFVLHLEPLPVDRTVRVGFVVINVQGRKNFGISSAEVDAFASYIKSMTYNRIDIRTGMNDVHVIDGKESALLSCAKSMELINWARKRGFDYSSYGRVIILYPFEKNASCSWNGMTHLTSFVDTPTVTSSGMGSMVIKAGLPFDERLKVMTHQFGRSMGMMSSAMDVNLDGVISSTEEFADPECTMGLSNLSFNPVHLHRTIYHNVNPVRSDTILMPDYGLEDISSQPDATKVELLSPMGADPYNDSIWPHPELSSPGIGLPKSWDNFEEPVAVIVRDKYYINRSIQNQGYVYIRRSIREEGRLFGSLLVAKVRVGNSYRFPDFNGDGICVIGESPDNNRLYVTYHSSMEADHECEAARDVANVTVADAPSSLVVKGGSATSTDNTPTIVVGGLGNNNWMVELFKDDQCREKVGFAMVYNGTVAEVTSRTLAPGNYEFYARAGLTASGMSTCSTAYAQYGVVRPQNPTVLSMVSPVVSTHIDDVPVVRVEGGINNGDWVRLYSDNACQNQISFPVKAGGSIVDIQSWPLEEGHTHRFFVRYDRPDANRSICWDSGVDYTVSVDANRTPRGVPTLPLVWSLNMHYPDDIIGRVNTPLLKASLELDRQRHGMEVAVYTDEACQTEVGRGAAPTRTTIYEVSNDVEFRMTHPQDAYIMTKPLAPGIYNFYAKSFHGEEFSECTRPEESAYYELLPPLENPPSLNRPPSPTGITLTNPGTSSSMFHNPTLRVDGVQWGDYVRFFQDSSCLISDILAVEGTTLPEHWNSWNHRWFSVTEDTTSVQATLKELHVGQYTFYAVLERNGVQSECSEVFASYQVLAPKPLAVTKMAVADPQDAVSGADSTPTIRVGGGQGSIDAGALVSLYTDSACSSRVGTAEASSKFVDVTTKNLVPGSYTFYSKYIRDGQESDCSVVSVDYEVVSSSTKIPSSKPIVKVKPDAPTGLRLVKPRRSPNRKKRPVIEISGVQTSDVVRLFTDNKCVNKVGAGMALKVGNVRIRTKKLSRGRYNFYANTTRNGVTSECSTASISYEVIK